MPILNWINDEDLISAVQGLMSVAKSAKRSSENKFERNVIDPFSVLFQISGFEIDFDTWITSERTRQAQKTLQNHIGEFHQSILGSVEGWENFRTGSILDIVSEEKKIIAEIKNKHNTVRGADLSNLYKSLSAQIMPKHSRYKGYTAYYVQIIPKRPIRFNEPFTPSDKDIGDKCARNELIREIDGASFYTLVTGDNNALENLFNVLPDVIRKYTTVSLSDKDAQAFKGYFEDAYGKS